MLVTIFIVIFAMFDVFNVLAFIKPWITCFGKLSFLCGKLRECQQFVSKIENVDVPQPENLLGELVDVVERVNQVSSLLSNTREVLA